MSTDHESRPTEEQPAAGETVKAPSPLGPVSLGERISSIDVLRGFALLGILMINKDLFAYSSSVIHDPTVQGGFEGLDFAIWRVGYVFFQMKFMALFSMLFGAGLILMWQRAGEDNPSFRGTYYRRLGWLLLFGLLHAYLLWYGDILFSYAVCGMVVYLFRRKKARTQIILGLIVVLFSLVPMFGMGAMMNWMQTTAESAQTAIDEGRTPTDLEASMLEAWNETKVGFSPPPEKIAEETEAMRSDFWTIFKHQAPTTIQMQTFVMLLFVFWRVAGLMLIGMGLMKLGVLAAQRSTGFYVWCMVIGYGIGLPISWYGSEQMLASDFSVVASYTGAYYYDYVFGLFVVLGHIGLIMLICKLGVLQWLQRRFAAVGRMALTNYLMQTLICTFIFYGWGLGLFGAVSRSELMLIVIGVWVLQMFYSPLWLERFRFGPAAWLWRTLTYKKKQRMRLRPKAEAAVA